MDWKGYTGIAGGVGGGLGCDGAMRLQWEHRARIPQMADVIPGQNTDASAREVMDETPW